MTTVLAPRPGPFDGAYLAVVGGALVVSAVALAATRPSLKRPVAAALFVAAVGVVLATVGPTPGLEWFAPALFLKLLAGHLVPERPFG